MTNPRQNRHRSPLIPILLLIVLLLGALVGWMLYILWGDSQQVFHDVTVELGQQTLDIRDFLTEKGKPSRASFVTDPNTIDLSTVGQTTVTLKHGVKTYVVSLTVEDTTPPEVVFLPEYTVALPDDLPQAGALVESVKDFSQVRTYYSQDPSVPGDYSDTTVTVVVEDTSGNAVEGSCVLHFTGWLKETCTLELGQELTPEMVLLDPQKDAPFLKDTKDIGATLGEHVLTVDTGGATAQCTVTVKDTTPPTLTVQSVRRFPGDSVAVTDFVTSATDLSGEPEVYLTGELPDMKKQGTYTVTIEAKDSSGNVTQQEATLWVSKNLSAPVISGASVDIRVTVNSNPDFLKGVTAKDDIDPKCEITVDTSTLDLSKPGTYYITYSSTDSSGNVGTCKRKVIVVEG